MDERTFDNIGEFLSRMFDGRRAIIFLTILVSGGIAFGYLILARNDFGSAIWVLAFVLGTTYWFVRTTYRKHSGKKVVLWLRRFHSIEPYRYPMLKTLKSAGDFGFHVATIQDTKFRYSYLAGILRSGCTLVLFFFGLAIPLMLLALGVSVNVLGFEPDGSTGMAGALKLIPVLLVAAPIFAVFFYPSFLLVTYLIVRLKGVERLRQPNFNKRILSWSRKVRQGRSGPFSTLKIFKCKDEFWKDAITRLLRSSDAAAIDVSDLNDNVGWEIRKSLEILGPEKLLFLHSVPSDLYPTEYVSDDLIVRLYQLIGDDVYKVPFWDYPEPLPVKRGSAVLDPDDMALTTENLVAGLEQALLAGEPG